MLRNTPLLIAALLAGSLPETLRAQSDPSDSPTYQDVRERGANTGGTISGGMAYGDAIGQLLRDYASGARKPPSSPGCALQLALAIRAEYGAMSIVRVQQIFLDWGASDPPAAIKEASRFANEASEQADPLVWAILGWAAIDADAAIGWIDEKHRSFEEPRPRFLSELYTYALLGYGAKRRYEDAAEAWLWRLDSIEALEATDNLLGALPQSLFFQWATDDLDGSISWIARQESQLPSAALENALAGIAGAWTKSDPEAAADYTLALPPGHVRSALLARAITGWSSSDSASAARWLARQQPSADLDGAIAALIAKLSESNAEAILLWFRKLETAEARNHAIYIAHQRLWASDPAEAVYLLAAYTPNLRRSDRPELHDFGGDFYWLQALAESLVRWSALEEKQAWAYRQSIDFLDDAQEQLLAQFTDEALHPRDLRDLANLLTNRYGTEMLRAKMSQPEIFRRGMSTLAYSGKGKELERVRVIVRHWSETQPSAIRYYLEKQRAIAGDQLAELLALVDSRKR